jgi:putative signal transducing protein
MAMPAGNDLVVIERARSTALAEELQSLLEAEGVRAFIDPYSADEVVAGELYTEFTGVDVKVAPADAARARAILLDRKHDSEVLNDLGDDVEVEGEAGEP